MYSSILEASCMIYCRLSSLALSLSEWAASRSVSWRMRSMSGSMPLAIDTFARLSTLLHSLVWRCSSLCAHRSSISRLLLRSSALYCSLACSHWRSGASRVSVPCRFCRRLLSRANSHRKNMSKTMANRMTVIIVLSSVTVWSNASARASSDRSWRVSSCKSRYRLRL